jgi:hypothetical protein
VQSEATQRRSVALSSRPDYLIVQQLDRQGGATEAQNGPGALAWENAGRMQKNGHLLPIMRSLPLRYWTISPLRADHSRGGLMKLERRKRQARRIVSSGEGVMLTPDEWPAIRHLFDQGVGKDAIARQPGISVPTVGR